MEKNWVSLHTHTEYSLLDGSSKIKDLVKKAKEMGMPAIAITDHGAMYGCVDFYKACEEEGIKPIIGCEVYVAGKSYEMKSHDGGNDTYHLVLLVKNEEGYKNLMKIVSTASIDGFYYKPRTDHEYLKKHSKGLIALSACLGGEVQANLLDGNFKKAEEITSFYKDLFGEDFYLEVQCHNVEDEKKVNEGVIELSKKLNIEVVATNDVHYINKEDNKAHDVLLCIQTSSIVSDEKRMRYPSPEFYLKSYDEMYRNFSYVPEVLENTLKVAEKCNFKYEFHHSKLPNFPLPEGVDHYKYLRDMCYKGLIERYDCFKDFLEVPLNIEEIQKEKNKSLKAKELIDRLEYELQIIKQMGYVDYFLIVWDFIRFSTESGIPTGPGRGSAAGSLVSYTLGITKIDPIKYSLLFERFLNPERVSMPDVDSDFCYERRGEVIEYVVEKYGEECVSQIITFGTMAARACIRDVGRAMGYSYSEVDRIAKMVPTVLGVTINKALELNPELKSAYDNEIRVKELIDIAKSLEGLPRHTSTHAAGVVISSKPLVNYVPLQKNEESIVSQFTMGTLEELGLLKMDFLGLRTLTVMNDAVKLIKENHGIDIDLDKIDFEDDNVYKMIGEGKTVGIFQLESPGMTSFMKELRPDSLEDIIAGISLYRPGPMAQIPNYIEGKKNPEKIKYLTPELESILNVTYGVMVYQEQVMEIVRKLAGYSMGRSDLVRRAMSKKKHKVMEEERKNFIHGIVDENGEVLVPGCTRNGISEDAANKIFDQMMDFASYAFNKSHAAAYAVVGYETAFLTKYYPAEYVCAMLNSVAGNNEKVAYYINFAKSIGIDVLPPTINKSFSKFTVKENKIRFGLAAIKNAGEGVVESIVKTRKEKGEFKDFGDFCTKIDLSIVNKRAVESLIKAGTMDEFQIYRSRLLAVYERLLEGINNDRRKNIEGQLNLFTDFSEDPSLKIDYPSIEEFNKKYMLSMEKEMTGLYLTGHPLDEHKEEIKKITNVTIGEIKKDIKTNIEDAGDAVLEETLEFDSKFKDGDRINLAGIISTVNKKVTKNNQFMAFLNLEDLTSSIEVIVFPKIYEQCRLLIEEDKTIVLRGRLNYKEEEGWKVIADTIRDLDEVLENGFQESLIRNTNSNFKRNSNSSMYNNPINNSQKKFEEVNDIKIKKIYVAVESEEELEDAKEKIRKLSKDMAGTSPIILCTIKERRKYMLSREFWVEEEKNIGVLKDIFGENNIKVI